MASAEEPTASKSSRVESNMQEHPVFGNLVESLPSHRLPSFLTVINYVRYLKSQETTYHGRLRPIYNTVANDLIGIWESAFVVPVVNAHTLGGRMQSDVEKKIQQVRSSLKFFTDPKHPDRLSGELSNLKKVYNISMCKCFIKEEYR